MNLAYLLNENCHCNTLDTPRLQAQLGQSPELTAFVDSMATTHPHLFSATQVFISESTYRAIVAAVTSLERVTALATWREHAMQGSAAIAQQSPGAMGVFMGYDFHVDETPELAGAAPVHLIEINTNAGGALLSTALARAQHLCCNAALRGLQPATLLAELENRIFAMFRNEWRLQRGDAMWRTVVIVDDAPASQFLAPEFALFQALFAARGINAYVADPSELLWANQQLSLVREGHAHTIDMVYNRLTDFDLSRPEHAALQQAYAHRTAVITPHPHVHALKANKRHLASLSDAALLASWGVAADDLAVLQRVVPKTRLVSDANAAELWAQRRHLFFKPVAGYAGKAAFRGDKITQKTWALIQSGGFVAQELVQPGRRVVLDDLGNDMGDTAEDAADGLPPSPLEPGHLPVRLKFDLRAYVYNGQIQHVVARVYNGQTTNMSTPGGGFAPVAVVPDIRWGDGPTTANDADASNGNPGTAGTSLCSDCLHH